MRGRGKSPSESLTRPLRGMCGPLLGTKVLAERRPGAATRRIGVGARGRREARGAGVLTERSAAERASTRRPEESLSAWDRERPRTRGRSAPQRRSALRGDTGRVKVPRRLRRARFGPGSKDPTPKRSAAERGVGTGNGCGNGIGNGVAQVTYIHIFHYPHTQERPSPLTPSGGKDASVCVGARGRAGYQIPGRVAIAKR